MKEVTCKHGSKWIYYVGNSPFPYYQELFWWQVIKALNCRCKSPYSKKMIKYEGWRKDNKNKPFEIEGNL